MGRETELLLEEVNKRLDKVETAIGALGGGGGATLALEATLQLVKDATQNIDTDGSTAANQTTANTLLTSISNAITALKDGEFKIFSDPNDNDRLVALTADMTTDPANPTYVYKYLDNNAVYGGNVNDLDQVPNSTQAAIEVLLTEIRDDIRRRDNIYYFKFDSLFPVGNVEITSDFEFNYRDVNNTIQAFSDGGTLAGTYADYAALIVALNGAQPHFEFYQLAQADIDRIENAPDTTLLGIRSNARTIPQQYVNGILLDTDLGVIPDDTLCILLANDTAVDENIRKVQEVKDAVDTLANLVSTLTDMFEVKRRDIQIELTTPTSGSFPGYGGGVGTDLISFEFIFENGISKEEFIFSPDGRPTIKNYDDLVTVINTHAQSLIAVPDSSSTNTLLRLKNGIEPNSNLVTLNLVFDGSSATYTRVGNSFTSFNEALDNTLDQILMNLELLLNDKDYNKDFLLQVAEGNVPGHSIVAIRGRNPDVDSGDAESNVWCVKATTITYPVANVAMEVLSDDATDTAAGVGLRTVRITGMQLDGTIIEEDIALNGTTPVALANNYYRILDMRGLTAGSTEANAGNVSVRTTVGTNVQDCIAIGFNRSASSNYTIPVGKTGFIVNFNLRVNRDNNNLNSVKVHLKARPNGGLFYNIDTYILSKDGQGSAQSEASWSRPISSLTDLQGLIVSVSDNDTDVVLSYDVLLVDNHLIP